MTFSDPSMATYFKAGLVEMLGEGVDLLFCNQDEAFAFTGKSNLNDAIQILKPLAQKLVLTLGSEGALVVNPDHEVKIAAQKVTPIDTNGAGDMFAGAFLYGLTQGFDDAQAGALASKAAAQIIQVYGARLDKQAHQALLKTV